MRARLVVSGVLIAAIAFLLLGSTSFVLAAGPIVPDSSCATENQYKSLRGDTRAALQIINNSDETVKTWWLDYNGKRVFYQDIKAHTSFLQPTWLTHPWVISSVAGACYRFLVMSSQEQSVTVEPELAPGETVAPLATPQPTANLPQTSANVALPSVVAQPTVLSPGTGDTESGQGGGPGPAIAIAAVAAAVVALLAWLVITGRLPGLPRRPR